MQVTAQYFAAQMLTREWAQPVDVTHLVFPAKSDLKDHQGRLMVTSYAVSRPDGQWALLLVNKDRDHAHSVEVSFHDAAADEDHSFTGKVTQISFGAENYTWHPAGQNGFAAPDGPAVHSVVPGGPATEYVLPKASITVLRGKVD
jgi:hypothetical protein